MNVLRRRLAGLYTATAGLIFLLIVAAFLIFSMREARNAQEDQFQIIWDSLSLRFQSSHSFSHSYLAQTEADYRTVIHIRENGIPFLFPGSWKPDTSRDLLIQRAKSQAEQEGVFMDQAPVSSSANMTSLMTLKGDFGDRYYARVLVLPSRHGGKSICAITLIPPVTETFGKTILYLSILTLLGIGCLWLISWKFVGWSLKPVKESQKKQAQFIASASHELRSPLAVLRSGISALDSMPQKKDTLLPLLESECVRMSRLIDDMLLLASADARTWTVRQEIVDMDTLLIDLYEAFLPACREKGIKLSLLLPDDALPPLMGDKERIRQLFFVLLDNAIHFTPTGRPVVLSARTDPRSRSLSLSVTDEGCGIPPDIRPFIFDRFYQADSSRSDKQHFGLGLSIAKELAELHQGKIIFSEGEKGGSCFTVILPVTEPGKTHRQGQRPQ